MLRATVSGVPTYADEDWVRLGEAIARRRVRLGLTQDDLADKADVSTNTIRHAERGGRSRMLTLPKIEAALDWEPGSCAAILEGDDPVELGILARDARRVPAADAFTVERPEELGEDDWEELRTLMNGLFASWIAARRRR